ncbi:MAG TPA: hypothetical protein VFH56_09260, partial [Acidimicrobiales bacterium]|nr:hypothetical protein [Acidimicrobiales bacterium]
MIEDEGVFGPDHENPNMYLSLTSARNYNQAMYGGHTVNLDALRRKHNIGKSTIEPGSGRSTDPQTEQWKESWATEMNRHFRFDPVWRRMLDGASDQEITDWLWSAEGRRMVRRRLLVANPREYVKDMRSQFDQMLPTDQARQLVRERTVSPDDVDAVIPHELREAIHADTLRTADRSQQTALWGKAVSWIYDHISSMPEDALVRHPFADLTYNTRLRNYYASLPKGTEITPGVQNAARASARAFTLKQVRRMLYNIAEENNAAYMMRYIMPFFQAHLEAVQRYFHIFTEKPEALARTAWLFNQSQTDNMFWTTVDENGKPANGHYSPNNKVIISARPWMRGLVNHIPGLKHALDDMGGLPVPAGSLDLMFQGSLINPGAGPLATLPAYEFYFKDHPGKDTNLFYKWLYGQYGVPRGSSLVSRVANSMLPAYLKRVLVAARDDETDSGYANTVANIMAEKSLRFEKQHGRAPVAAELDQMGNDAVAEAKGFYYLRSLVSFGSPLPIQGQVKHQYYIDLARQYKQKFGAQWQQKFFDKVGPEFYRFAVAGSQSNNGLNPTAGAAKTYYQLKPLIDQAPDLAGLIVGPQAQNGAFSPSVYQWQLNTKMGPGSSKTMREHPDARTEIANQQIETGWQEWGKVQAGVDAELAARGLDNVMQKDAQDVFIHMQEEKRRIIRENPAWEGAFLSRDANLPNIIHQMSSIAFNPKLNGRPDIMGLRKYLYSRQQMQKVL